MTNKTEKRGRPSSFKTQKTELVSAMVLPSSTVKKVRMFAKRNGLNLNQAFNALILEK
jgi:hypothetical protein